MSLTVYGLKAVRPEMRGVIRDLRVTWTLEELGLSYEHVLLDPSKGENKTPAYLKLNPTGKVPTLVDGDFAIFESSAICEYLAEKNGKLMPNAGTPAYYHCKQWMFFVVCNMEPLASRIFATDHMLEKNATTTWVRQAAVDQLQRFLEALNAHFANRDYFGEEFSVAEILLTTSLASIHSAGLVQAYPNLLRVIEKMRARPAFRSANAANGVGRNGG